MDGTWEDSLDDLRVFAVVAEEKNLTKAARRLEKPKSTISRRLGELETALGTSLLARNPRRVELTPAGLALARQIAGPLATLRESMRTLVREQEEQRGTVRVTMPGDFGRVLCMPLVQRFLEQRPEVSLDVRLTDRRVDLVAEGIDAAVRVGTLRETGVVARRVGSFELALVASPAYLSKRGRPKRPEDLAEHDCIVFRSTAASKRWTSGDREIDVPARFTVNALVAARDAALAGLGVALLPTYVLIGDLERLLVDDPCGTRNVYVAHVEGRVPARVRRFLDFMAEALAEALVDRPRPARG
jgi:DNA-binding transcriptional LysR family regulator